MKNLPVRLWISRFFVAREGLSMLFCKQIRARISNGNYKQFDDFSIYSWFR